MPHAPAASLRRQAAPRHRWRPQAQEENRKQEAAENSKQKLQAGNSRKNQQQETAKGNGGIAPPFPSPIGTLVRNVNSLKTTSAMRRVVPRPANQVSTDNIVDISPLLEKNYRFTIAQGGRFSRQFTTFLKILHAPSCQASMTVGLSATLAGSAARPPSWRPRPWPRQTS